MRIRLIISKVMLEIYYISVVKYLDEIEYQKYNSCIADYLTINNELNKIDLNRNLGRLELYDAVDRFYFK